MKPYCDKSGNLYFPNDTKFGGQVTPTLKPREWLTLLYLQTENIPNKKNKKMEESLCGSRTTKWRTIKKLKEKGYLP